MLAEIIVFLVGGLIALLLFGAAKGAVVSKIGG